MKRILWLAACVAAFGLAYLRAPEESAPDAPRTAAPVDTPARVPPPPQPSVAAPAIPPPSSNLYVAQQDFERDVRAFLDGAARLDAAQRERRARELESAISEREAARMLSAGEAVVLRTALIRATIDDPATQGERIVELTEWYRARAAERTTAWAQRNDPAFAAYKDRERAVVDEVMALRAIPGGLTRDEYLRQRLQAERERAENAQM